MKKLIIFMLVVAIAMIPLTDTSKAEEKNTNESNVLSDAEISDDNIAFGEVGAFWTFVKDSEKKYYATSRAKKVSADYKPNASCTVSTSKTFSVSFSATISSSQKSLIKSSASANVVNSMTSSTSYTLPNDSKKYAHVLFTPRYDKITGKLKKRNSMDGSVISQKSVTAYYPVKLASKGELDGTYDLEYHAKNKCNR